MSNITNSNISAAAEVSPEQAVEYPRRSAEACMESYLNNLGLEREERPSDDIIEAAEASVFGELYPNGEEHALVRVHPRFECPFTGKLFGSIDELVHAAISHFIGEHTAEELHDAEPTGSDVLHEVEELPYVADQWEIGFMRNKDTAAWAENFSRCFGWLVLDPEQVIVESGGMKLREELTQNC